MFREKLIKQLSFVSGHNNNKLRFPKCLEKEVAAGGSARRGESCGFRVKVQVLGAAAERVLVLD